jgi:hypothetical protein
MPRHIRTLQTFLIAAALAWAGAVSCLAQSSAEEFRGTLLKGAALTAEELSALERGEVVVKTLPAVDKREVAFRGVARLRGEPAALLAAFKESLTRSGIRVIRGSGTIGIPPADEDLQALSLENGEIEDMKQCAVGDCKVKMSAAMIARLRGELDWGAPGYRTAADRLFKSMLLDYVRDYLARGDAALIQYEDRARAVRQEDEQRSLLASLPYVSESAPEFAAYLRGFPQAELPGVENSFQWSEVKVGLKPVVLFTHTATYTRQSAGAPQILIVTKQLYATHYFDSSLSLTLLTGAAGGDGPADTYLFYANRSRLDTLGGLFGGVRRRVIETQVLEGLSAVLQRTKFGTEAGPAGAPRPDTQAVGEEGAARRWAGRWTGMAGYLFLALSLLASVILLLLRRRDLKTRGT